MLLVDGRRVRRRKRLPQPRDVAALEGGGEGTGGARLLGRRLELREPRLAGAGGEMLRVDGRLDGREGVHAFRQQLLGLVPVPEPAALPRAPRVERAWLCVCVWGGVLARPMGALGD